MRGWRQTCQECSCSPAFWGSWLVISVLQTVACSLAGRQLAGLWVVWKRPQGSSLGKSVSVKTTSISVGLPSSAPGGWCLLPTASTSESTSLWAQSPPCTCVPSSFRSGDSATLGVSLELAIFFPSLFFLLNLNVF